MNYTKNHDGLLVPDGFKNLTKEVKDAICNGMGPKGWGWLVPDHFYGLDMSTCGNIHDFCYYQGGTGWDKITADMVFLHNMIRVVWLNKNKKWRRYAMATRYFLAVFWGGKKSFNLIK